MLESLKLRNFQKFRRKVIDFKPGVNCLVGISGKGKSAILRALRWLALNQPAGVGFIKHGEDSCSAILKVDDKEILRRRDRKTENVYSIGSKEFKAFGQATIPEEVRSILNMGDLNFQRQFDGPFWLSLSAGEVSRELNQIVNLDAIDNCLSGIAADLRQAMTEAKLVAGRISSAEQTRDRLSWVPELEADLADLEALTLKEQEAASRSLSAASIYSKAVQLRETLSIAQKQGEEAGEVLKLQKKSGLSLERSILLSTTIGRIEHLHKQVISKEQLDNLELVCNRATRTQEQLDHLIATIDKCQKQEAVTCELKRSVTLAEKDLRKTMGGKCPLCGSKMPIPS